MKKVWHTVACYGYSINEHVASASFRWVAYKNEVLARCASRPETVWRKSMPHGGVSWGGRYSGEACRVVRTQRGEWHTGRTNGQNVVAHGYF